MADLTLNVFKPKNQKGDVVFKDFGLRIEAKIASTETGTLVPGTVVKLVDVSGDKPAVAIAAASDTPFGVVQYEAKKNSYTYAAGADNSITIASFASVIKLEASAAIAAGAKVEYVPTGAKVVTNSTGVAFGKALDKATASGDIIKVMVLVPNLA